MANFPIKRDKNASERGPSERAIFETMEVATTPEAADYLVEHYSSAMKNPAFLEEFRENVHLQNTSTGRPWDGIAGDTRFKNLQANLAMKTAEALSQKLTNPIKVSMDIYPDSEFTRGFSAKGKAIDADEENLLEKFLKAYLAGYQIVAKSGVLYETTDNGKMTSKKADPERVEKLIMDKDKGLQAYLESNGVKTAAVRARQYTPPQAEKEAPAEGVVKRM
ncbi:MAG: hypothetical protein WC785_08685 [Tatlockia sp.]|jgi:hypothetical protein